MSVFIPTVPVGFLEPVLGDPPGPGLQDLCSPSSAFGSWVEEKTQATHGFDL